MAAELLIEKIKYFVVKLLVNYNCTQTTATYIWLDLIVVEFL